jgi:hypothetical protein
MMVACAARAEEPSPSPAPDQENRLSQENAALREQLRQAEAALAQKKLDDSFAAQKIVLSTDGGYQTRAGADHVYSLGDTEFLRRYQQLTGKLPPLGRTGGDNKALFAGGLATLVPGLAAVLTGAAMLIAEPNPPHIPLRDAGIALTSIGGAAFVAGFSMLAARRWRKKPPAIEANQARALVDEYNHALLDMLKR